ncbi:MAG: hypothetical protein AAF715_16755 [Myxococcota bacterium]
MGLGGLGAEEACVLADLWDDDDDQTVVRPFVHEPIGAGSFASGTVLMEQPASAPKPRPFGQRTLRVSKEEIFANSAPLDWERLEATASPEPSCPPESRPAPSAPPHGHARQLTEHPPTASETERVTATTMPPPSVAAAATSRRARIAAAVCVTMAGLTTVVTAWHGVW